MDRKVAAVFLRFFAVSVMLLMSFTAYAQNSFTVKLKLVDEKTADPVSFATASLTVKGETAAAKYVLTDAEGTASLTKVRKGTYVFKAELMGYKPHEQEIVVDKNLDLGEIKMSEDVEVLDAASVSAVGNPIVVKKDTIEYLNRHDANTIVTRAITTSNATNANTVVVYRSDSTCYMSTMT